MNRRNAIRGLATLGYWPLVSLGQQSGRIARIGVLASGFRPATLTAGTLGGFQRGMRELGMIEGKDFTIEWRFGEGKATHLDALAAELLQAKVDVIVAATPLGVAAAKRATATIPIVMVAVADPIFFKFVSSLARPDGNITGLTNLSSDLTVKYLELLRSAIPTLSSVAAIIDEELPIHRLIATRLDAASKHLGVKLITVSCKTEAQIEPAVRSLTQERVGALIVVASPFASANAPRIAESALKSRLPTLFWTREHVVSGGLMSYGQDNAEHYRLAADYVVRILKGAKPGDLPIQQPTKVELVVNRRTASALGLSLSGELLLRADEIVE